MDEVAGDGALMETQENADASRKAADIAIRQEAYDLGYLTRTVEEAGRKAESSQKALEERITSANEEITTARGQTRWLKIAAYGGAIVGVVGLLVGSVGVYMTRTANAERAEARITSCNERTRDRISFNSTLLFVGGYDRQTGLPTPELLAADEARQAQSRDFLANLRPLPICTPDAIALYLRSNGVFGVQEIDPTNYRTAVEVLP